MSNITKINPNGVILYEGPSLMDGAPIVVIATGLAKRSDNGKTGDMVQTWIIRADMSPADAIASRADSSICGTCIHRGTGAPGSRSCYVIIHQAPRSVYAAYKRGVYAKAKPSDIAAIGEGRMVRLGSYGDPAAAPIFMWQDLVSRAIGWTGYTHAWQSRPDLAPLVMASADSVADLTQAHAAGFRTFRVAPVAGAAITGAEVSCPASEEAGRKTDCASCRACMGTSAKARVSIVIAAHGNGANAVTRRAA
jgi:hypothetical protein